MSLVKIQGNASGTGEFTIAAPNSNTNRTLTLPDNTGTILTSATAGSVLQVVSATYSTSTSTSGTTLVDTGLSASITPTSSSSKILVLVTMNGLLNSSVANTGTKLAILRGSTNINTFAEYTCYIGSSVALIASAAGNYLDSPSTTSSTTYKVQFARRDGSGTVYVQANSDSSTIVLMEIAA
jgi:hypothetical protein